MKLHERALGYLTRRIVDRRPPDVVIGGSDDPYMLRWWVIPRNRLFNVYLHHFRRSDDDRALHDHPWPNLSWLLRGDYLEVIPQNAAEPAGRLTVRYRSAGDFAFRKAEFAHRIKLLIDPNSPDISKPAERPVWTLFVTGPRIRDWGFWCPKGWRHWKDFTAFRSKGNGNEVGPGCGEP